MGDVKFQADKDKKQEPLILEIKHVDQIVKQEAKYTTSKLPYLPPSIEFKQLHQNGLLLSKEEIKKIKDMKLADGRHEKEKLQISHHIIVLGDRILALPSFLGQGSYGAVFLAQEQTESADLDQWLACKVQDEISQAEQEHQVLRALSRDKGECIARDPSSETEAHEHISIMTLERGINLGSLIKSGKKLPPHRWVEICIQLLESVSELHTKHKLLHRDLHRGNMMVSKKAKVIDFGFAVAIPEGGELKIHEYAGYLGNPTAPEVSKDPSKPSIYSEKSEVFNLASILEEILTSKKRMPYPAMREEIKKLVSDMRNPDRAKRPTIKEVIELLKNNIYTELLKIPYANVGILDEEEFFASDAKQKQAFIASLKPADIVWLVDPKKSVTREQHIHLQRLISAEGIEIEDDLLHASQKEFKTLDIVIDKCADTDKNEQNKMHNYFYCTQQVMDEEKIAKEHRVCVIPVSPAKKSYHDEFVDYLKRQPLSPRHRGIIVEGLQKEIKRLDQRLAATEDQPAKVNLNHRIRILKENKATFVKGEFIHYHDALKQLDRIQQAMLTHSASKLGRLFCGLFRPHVTSAIHVKNLKKKIKSEVVSTRLGRKNK